MTFNPKKHKDDLLFLPLGGANEIGMNVNLYHYQGKWLMIDCGAGFADETLPGIDMLVPDLSFVHQYKKDFVGLVLTHAHEDHLGAIQYLWRDFTDIPIYTTPFTAAVLRAKLRETDFGNKVKINILQNEAKLKLDPFDLELVYITHSIPEMNAIRIKTKYGDVFHTGDWKFDHDPLVGPQSNQANMLSNQPALALVCDSTNVFNPGHSGSEGDLRKSLTEIISKCRNQVIVTTFASNIARVETIAKVAKACNRKVAIAGRSLKTITGAAKETGYLKDINFINENDIKKYRRDELLIICTGCQGEIRAAMSKIADGTHPSIKLHSRDTVIFSSKIIPGNEKKIYRLFNRFSEMNIELLTEKDHFVHVSGHPAKEELQKMYELTRPKIAIPVHGERVHINEHVKLAKQWGVPQQVNVKNGDMVKIAPGNPEKLEFVQSGYYAVDGNSIIPTDSEIIRTRRKLQQEGMIMVTMVIDGNGNLISKPKVLAPGILDAKDDKDMIFALSSEIGKIISSMNKPGNQQIEDNARGIVKRFFRDEIGKIPNVEIQVIRL